jgi:hypothetical protein
MGMKAVVDRIEEDLAVLLLKPDEQIQFTLPSEVLSGMKEGDIVDIVVTVDEPATREAGAKTRELAKKLKNR